MRTFCLVMMSLAIAGCKSPTSPDARTGYMALRVTCDDQASNPLMCRAQTYCAGLYRCPDPAGDNADVTGRVAWTVEHPSILQPGTQPNWFVAAGPGDTTIRVSDETIRQEALVRVSVFSETLVPMLTTEVWGRVSEAGTMPVRGVRGAVVELTGPLIGTRTAITGTPAQVIPGYAFLLGGDDGYQFFGIPRGTYQLSIRADGYVPQTQTVTVTPPGSPSVDFRLERP